MRRAFALPQLPVPATSITRATRRRRRLGVASAFLAIAMVSSPAAAQFGASWSTPVQWSLASGGNDHWYAISVSSSELWATERLRALAFGGDLASVTSRDEELFIDGAFGTGAYWNGFVRGEIPGVPDESSTTWTWSDGSGSWDPSVATATYANWCDGEPNASYETYATMNFFGPTCWADQIDSYQGGLYTHAAISEFTFDPRIGAIVAPEPASAVLLATGLICVFGVTRRPRRPRRMSPMASGAARGAKVLAALVSFLPGLARAQAGTNVSAAVIYDAGTGSYACAQSQVGAFTAASCPLTALGSSVSSANSVTNSGLRTFDVSATATGSYGGSGLSVNGATEMWSSIAVTGTAHTGDLLVFHLLANPMLEAFGSSPSTTALWVMTIWSGGTFAQAQASVFGDEPIEGPLVRATRTATGFDFFLPFLNDPTVQYTLEASAVANLSTGQSENASLSATVSGQLSGIDAIAADGRLIASATFDQGGLATLDVTATPEPVSLVLLGTGLLGIVGAARRRRGESSNE
jgi:hypothetical protein